MDTKLHGGVSHSILEPAASTRAALLSPVAVENCASNTPGRSQLVAATELSLLMGHTTEMAYTWPARNPATNHTPGLGRPELFGQKKKQLSRLRQWRAPITGDQFVRHWSV